jgi:LysR family transcriptional regulator, glycine cleavage system transcriptional activator
MAKRLPDLPSLDLLRGFEAAARHLSFTLAAAELYLTQSAVSRQIATLEARLGVRLFVRRNRGLTLTDDGETLRAAVAKAFREVDDALERIRSPVTRTLNVTASVAFSALWLVPRLPRFAREHPGVDVRLSATSALLDLARDRIDVAVRYCAPHAAPADAVELFGGDVVPVCSPKLLRDRARPLKTPADLRHHVLLHYDDPLRPMPWQAWSTWLEAAGIPDLKPAGSLHFSHLDHAVLAAVEGQGLALGIRSVLGDLLADRRLVVPFAQASRADRGYFAIIAPGARERPEAVRFVQWLQQEVAATLPAPSRPPAHRRPRSQARAR